MRKMSAAEFVRRVKASSDDPDTRFAFFIGSGCSRSSGIPTAGELVKEQWLPRLRSLCSPEIEDGALDDWAARRIAGYDPANPAGSYGAVIEELFLTPGERQVEIERLCDGKFPRFGYATLASLIAHTDGSFNVALTTNFDDLIADALYLFTPSRPLVIQHESLSEYIRPTRTRPLVVKLHGDHRLSPLNTAQETMQLKESINRAVKALLQDRGLIVLGYGGADQGILRMLGELTGEALPFGVYWVSRSEPVGGVADWLDLRDGTWVEHDDFDKLTMLMRSTFDLPAPDERRFSAVFGRYADDYTRLTNEIAFLTDVTPGTLALKEAARRTDETFEGPWAVLVESRRLRQEDRNAAKVILERGLEEFPDSVPLLSELAILLSYSDPNGAERLFARTLQLAPNDPLVLANYATFLHYMNRDSGQAEALYLRALEIDPDQPRVLGSYANFLQEELRDLDVAERCLVRSLEIDPNDPDVLGNYANFLAIQRHQFDQADQLYRRALEIDPNNIHSLGNLAGLLLAKGDQEAGMELLNRAMGLASNLVDTRLRIELWFYKYAHGSEATRGGSLSALRSLLDQGFRSPGWDLTRNSARACEDGHPECKWLEPLAKVITESADLATVENWPAWQSASGGSGSA
jgi:protein O-mannosyl-transferase